MHIDVRGQGRDLVLIHGWAMHGGIFAGLVEHLSARFRVHVVDLPGHGYSRDDSHFDVVDCAERIVAKTPPALWVGWSLGGLVALHAALAHPQQVHGLGMLASSPRFVTASDWPHGVDATVFGEFSIELQQHYQRAIDRFLTLESLGSPHAPRELRALKQIVFERREPNANALVQGLRALEHCDLRSELPHLAMPSLWMAGRRDRVVHPAALRWSATQAPRARYLEFNSGHAPFLEHADAMADALGHFATELST